MDNLCSQCQTEKVLFTVLEITIQVYEVTTTLHGSGVGILETVLNKHMVLVVDLV